MASPQRTPEAIALSAAEHYYEPMGKDHTFHITNDLLPTLGIDATRFLQDEDGSGGVATRERGGTGRQPNLTNEEHAILCFLTQLYEVAEGLTFKYEMSILRPWRDRVYAFAVPDAATHALRDRVMGRMVIVIAELFYDDLPREKENVVGLKKALILRLGEALAVPLPELRE